MSAPANMQRVLEEVFGGREVAAEAEPLLCELLFVAGESGDLVDLLRARQHEAAEFLNQHGCAR